MEARPRVQGQRPSQDQVATQHREASRGAERGGGGGCEGIVGRVGAEVRSIIIYIPEMLGKERGD